MVKQFTLVKRLPLFVMQKNVMGKLLYCDFRLVYCVIQSTMKSTICSSEILFYRGCNLMHCCMGP